MKTKLLAIAGILIGYLLCALMLGNLVAPRSMGDDQWAIFVLGLKGLSGCVLCTLVIFWMGWGLNMLFGQPPKDDSSSNNP